MAQQPDRRQTQAGQPDHPDGLLGRKARAQRGKITYLVKLRRPAHHIAPCPDTGQHLVALPRAPRAVNQTQGDRSGSDPADIQRLMHKVMMQVVAQIEISMERGLSSHKSLLHRKNPRHGY